LDGVVILVTPRVAKDLTDPDLLGNTFEQVPASADRWLYLLSSASKIEPIKIHDFAPRSHEITHEFRLRVAARIDFC
jgi:hypothetical protein